MQVSRFIRLALTCMAWLPLVAIADTSAPGSGFTDPAGVARRPAPADIDPVMRPAAVDTLATLRNRGVLRVGVVPVEPMVMLGNDGALMGYSVDIARKLAVDLGVKVEFIQSSWPNVISDLLERRFDLIASGLWITAPRALVVNFTSPTAVEGVYLIAGKKKAARLNTQADFNRPGVTIAIYAGAAQEALAQRAFPKATLIQVQDDPLNQVLGGFSHAALVPSLTPQVVVNAAPDKLKLALASPVGTTSAAIAVRKGDPDFLSFLNTWLALQAEQGWLQERKDHWFAMSNWIK